MTRTLAILAGVLLLGGCAHKQTPEHRALMQRGDCSELLRAADAARADDVPEIAADLAAACSPDGLQNLVDASTPAQALLWCGRAAAAGHKGCSSERIALLAASLHPRLTIGPPDEAMAPHPLLAAALDQLRGELNLSWQPHDPDVIVGKLNVSFEHVTSTTFATVPDAKGDNQRVPAVQHRFVARAEAEVGLAGKTRVVRAQEEARDLTWDAEPRLAVPARFSPQVPAEEELKKRAAVAWVRVLAKALAATPPEAVDVSDDKGCVAYGLSLNLNSGDPGAAAKGAGDPAKVAACEKLLGEPAGAGIPVP
jgi:hypothetical protein